MAINALRDASDWLVDATRLEFDPNLSGAVATVGATVPITSTGGVNPQIGLTTPLAVQYGGTGDATMVAGYVKSPGGTTALTTQAVPIPIADGGTGTGSAPTAGAIVFGAGGAYAGDAANLFWDTGNKRQGIGTNVPQTSLSISKNAATLPAPLAGTLVQVGQVDGTTPVVEVDGFGNTTVPTFVGRVARNTAAAPIASGNGDVLCQIGGIGYGTTGYGTALRGAFRVSTGEAWTDANQGTYASIYTTATGGTSTTEKVRVDPAGNVGIGVIPPLCALDNQLGDTRFKAGSNIASASTIAPAVNAGNIFHVTGTATINTITSRTGAGDWLTLIADGLWALGATGNIKATARTRELNETVSLTYDGSNWYETANRDYSNVINLASRATGGIGTAGSPWTGWDTAIGTPQANTHYYAPAGVYSYSVSPNWGQNGLWLEGDSAGINAGDSADGGTVFVCTGTGDVFTVNGNNGVPNGEQIRIENIIVRTSNAASTGNGFALKRLVYCTFINLRARDCGAAGFSLDGVQNCIFHKPMVIGTDGTGWPAKRAVNGFLFQNLGTGSTVNTFNCPSVEGVSGDACVIGNSCFGNFFYGGAFQANVGRGININPGADSNTFQNVDCEANTGTDDILDAGDLNSFYDCRVASVGVTNSFHFTFGSGVGRFGKVFGGFAWKPILIDAGRLATLIGGKVRYFNGLSDNGSYTTIDAWSDAVSLPLAVPGVLFAQTATQTIANTTSATTLFGSGVGTLTIPANLFTPGRTLRIRINGTIGNGGTGPTLHIRTNIGGSTTNDAFFTMAGVAGPAPFVYILELTCRTNGVSGTFGQIATFQYGVSNASPNTYWWEDTSSSFTPTINTTVARVVDVTGQWGTASVNNTISSYTASLEFNN